MLRYQALKYFTVVARHQSITRAAEALYLSQSGLSVHMRNLERELGVPLLIRSNRNVRLSPAGQALYDWAAPFFDREEQAILAVRRAGMAAHNEITIGTVGANITYLLSDIVQRFHERHGDIRVTMERMNMDPLNEALRAGNVDLGIQFLTEDLGPEYAHHILERGRMVLAAHKSSPLAGKERVSFADLAGVPIACLSSASAVRPKELLLQKCADLGFKPHIVAEFDYVEPILTMVNMGACVTLTSDLAPLSGLENICYVELEDAVEIDLALIWYRDSQNPAAQLFIRHVQQSVL